MNEMWSEKYQNEEIQHYQDEESRSINTNENQLLNFFGNIKRNLPK